MVNTESKKEPMEEAKTARSPKKNSERKKSEGTAPVGKKEYKETILLFIKILVTIFLCEAAIMALLYILPLKSGWEIVADPLLLTFLGTPVLYWLLVKPVWLALEQRSHAVEALKSERDFTESLITTTQAVVLLLDSEGRIKHFNPYMERISGYRLEEVKGKDWFTTFLPERNQKRTRELFSKSSGGIQTHGNSNPIVTKNGCEREIEWYDKILKDANGNLAGLLATGQDITDRKRATEALQKQRRELQIILDSVPAGIWYKDTENRLVRINKAAAESINMKPEDIEGRQAREIFPENAEHYYEDDLEVIRSGKPKLGIIEEMEVPGGEKKWVRTDKVPYRDEQGNISGVIAFVEDITKRKQAVEALQKSEHKYRSLVEANPYGIQEINASGIITYTNPAYQKIFGYSEQELLGKSVLDLFEPESRREELRDYLSILIEEQPQPTTYYQKSRTKEGRVIDMEVDWNYNRDNEGHVVGFVSIVTDVTERKKAEEKLLNYQAKLKFLASQLSLTEERERRRIATELHDQIGQSLVFSKIKLDELRKSVTSGELTKALGEICNNIDQIIQNTRSLTFDLSSPILNELGLEVAVAEWLREQIREKHGIETKFEDDGQSKPLSDDIRALLFRNVRELLINVVKHANAQSVKVSILKIDERICVTVQDDGVGFDPAEVVSLTVENAGFGIFSIRERLEHLGGSFEIKSEPGRGSKITMTAPLK